VSPVATRRVQRVPAEWPVLHLEAAPPAWDGLVVDGLVRHPGRFGLQALKGFGPVRRVVAVHCVWGWSRTDACWEGVGLDQVFEVVEPEAGWMTVSSASGTYSACLPLVDAARGTLVWARDGETLPTGAGGPLRFLPPPDYWAYKGVKWADRVTIVDCFRPGFWESKVADPLGRIPEEVVLP